MIVCWRCSSKLGFPRKYGGEFARISRGTFPLERFWMEVFENDKGGNDNNDDNCNDNIHINHIVNIDISTIL